MRWWCSILVFLLPVVWVAGEESRVPTPVPETMDGEGYEYPVWVAASAVLDEAGEVRVGLFREDWLTGVERSLDGEPEDGCVRVLPTIAPVLEPAGGRVEGGPFVTARGIARVEVVGRGGGFFFGEPGTLLVVRLDENTVGTTVGTEVWAYRTVFVPQGRFRVGEVTVCPEAPGAPPLPEIGEHLLYFVPTWEEREQDSPRPLDNRALVVVHDDESISVHQDLLELHPGLDGMSYPALKQWVRSLREGS